MLNNTLKYDNISSLLKIKQVKNEKCPLKDLEYGEKTENHGK